MKNRFAILLFSLLFALGVFGFAFIIGDCSNPAYALDSSFGGGTGTSDSPYLISTTAHLDTLASDVAGGNTYAGKCFKLSADINFNETPFNAIGTKEYAFEGVFDGNGCLLKNISVTIDKNAVVCGVFANIKNARIMNLGIESLAMSTQDLELAFSSSASIGALVGLADNSIIENSFVADKDVFTDLVVSTTYSINVGGLVGRADVSRIQNCYTAFSMSTTQKCLGTASVNIGGIVGLMNNTRLYSSYSSSEISASYDQDNNDGIVFSVGGIAGTVFGSSNSEMKNAFFVGINYCADTTVAVFNQGTIIGQVTSVVSQTPSALSLNYCHAKQEIVGMQAIGNKNNYSTTTDINFSAFTNISFTSLSLFQNAIYWDENFLYDFDRTWSFEESYPVLQQFCFYTIGIDQVSNCTIYFGEETTVSSERELKSGQKVVLRVVIDEEVSEYYSVLAWKHKGVELPNSNNLVYEFKCSYVDSGTYSVVLKPKDFSVTIAVANEQTTFGGFKIGGSSILTEIKNRNFAYGQTINLTAVPKTTSNGISYAFDGWYVGTTKVSTAENYSFVVGDELVPGSDDPVSFSISLTAQFSQDSARLSISFDGTKGKVKLSETSEFSADQIDNKWLKLNGTYTLYAEANDGYLFVGWYSAEEGGTQLSKDATYSTFVLENDQTTVFARFSAEENTEKGGMSGWAIFGIIAGSLTVVAAVVLAIIFGKKRTNYKSGFNF